MRDGFASIRPETDIKYHIPYSWGALSVTAEADKAYGFVPLTADAKKGPQCNLSPKSTDDGVGVRTSIVLSEEKEFVDKLSSINFDEIGRGHDKQFVFNYGEVIGEVSLSRNNLNILSTIIGATETKTSIEDGISDLEQGFGLETGDLKDMAGIPAIESVDQFTRKVLMGSFCEIINEITSKAVFEYLKSAEDTRVLRRITKIGAAGLIGSGATLGLFAAGGGIDTTEAAISMYPTAASFWVAKRKMMDRIAVQSIEKEVFEEKAKNYANNATNAIFNDFSTDRFDAEIESMWDN